MRFFTLLLLASCLLSCKAQQKMAGEEMENLVLVESDGYSGIAEYEVMLIKDTKSLNKFYSQVNKTRKPGLPVPMLDFTKEMAIVVCLGEQKGERVPYLSQLSETEEERTIAIELPDLEQSANQTQLPTSYPFYVYKLPISSKAINFQKVGW
jgi:hypothetical protein